MATSNEAEKARHALRRRRRLRQVLGAVVCVLVVIGLASVISGGVRLTASLFDDTEEKEEFELRLQTLVSLDPEPFDSLESANRARLSCVRWRAWQWPSARPTRKTISRFPFRRGVRTV